MALTTIVGPSLGAVQANGAVTVNGAIAFSNTVASTGNVITKGVHTLSFPGTAFAYRATVGANANSIGYQSGTGGRQVIGPAFSFSANSYLQCWVCAPKSINTAANLTASFVFSSDAANSGNVMFAITTTAFDSGDASNDQVVTYATGSNVSTTYAGAQKVTYSANTASFAFGGTLANGALLEIRVGRLANITGDTLNANVYLLAVNLHFSYDKETD
jgi:hypothetical protein